MERATALFRLRFAGERGERAMIGNRKPRADRDRDDQATRSRFHVDSIDETVRILKCFLPVRPKARAARS